MKLVSRYYGYSSQQCMQYDAARYFLLQKDKATELKIVMQDPSGKKRTLKIPATWEPKYIPRLPVPNERISDSADMSWKMLDGKIGYIYVRRIGKDLINSLDKAVNELKGAKGLIIDVRGNTGGGFDAGRAHRNFAVDDIEEPGRPRFGGPVALLTDARCISAGEGWASWFIAKKRAKVFGSPTAGASARKDVYTLKNGLYKVQFSIKAYKGFLDRPIERTGLEPDVAVRQKAKDLAAGRDTILETARAYLIKEAKGKKR